MILNFFSFQIQILVGLLQVGKAQVKYVGAAIAMVWPEVEIIMEVETSSAHLCYFVVSYFK